MKTSSADSSDADLVARVRQGSTESFDLLVLRHQEKIYNVLYRLCGNWEDAGDLTQKAFINAFRKIGTFAGDCAFSTWIYRIAFNLAMSHLRDPRRSRTHLLSDEEERQPKQMSVESDASGGLERAETHDQVHRALGLLEEEERQVIVLKDLEDRSYEEIAATLEIPVGTVRSRLHRGRASLKIRLRQVLGTSEEERASKWTR